MLVFAGGGGRLWVLRQAAARDSLLRPQLLRGVWQRRGNDVCGRDTDVLLPGKNLRVFLLASSSHHFLPRSWSRARRRQNINTKDSTGLRPRGDPRQGLRLAWRENERRNHWPAGCSELATKNKYCTQNKTTKLNWKQFSELFSDLLLNHSVW